MAFVYVQDLEGMQLADYDRVNEALKPDEDPPDGLILHTASGTDSGVRIVDVWESREAEERFRDGRLMPAVQQAGLQPGSPNHPDVHEVHHLLKP